MIINEDGEIISKGNEINKRHRWNGYSPNEWECTKCTTHKHRIDKQEYNYSKDGQITKLSPECDNSKITIINNSKKEKNDKAKEQQLSFGW
jgi:hypothetical protein